MNAAHLSGYILLGNLEPRTKAVMFHSSERGRKGLGRIEVSTLRRKCYYQLLVSIEGNLEVLRDGKGNHQENYKFT